MSDFKFKKLTEDQLEQINLARIAIREKIRNVPEEGIEIDYLGKKFKIFRNVFWPHEDAKALIKNFVINSEENVLDIGTGSGIIAIFSAYKGAKKVVALDINPDAVTNAKVNADWHGFKDVIDVRLSDGISAVRPNEMFDVITANPPMSNKPSKDLVKATMFDTDFKLHKDIFTAAKEHLNVNGRMYLTQANFGNLEKMLEIADESGFEARLIGENPLPNDFRVFYAFELTRK